MHLPGLQISLWPHVTLTFDLMTPKVDSFMHLLYQPLVLAVCIKIGPFVFKISW